MEGNLHASKRVQDFNAAQFDKPETYALATGHAHALFMAASAPAGLTELSDEVAKARELLLSDAVALAKETAAGREALSPNTQAARRQRIEAGR